MTKRYGALLTLAACGLALLAAPGASAQDADYAEGWINLFDGETLFGWTVIGDGRWEAKDEALTCEWGAGGWIATNSQFGDFELKATVRVQRRKEAALVVRAGLEGHPSENGGAVIPLKGLSNGGWEEVKVVANGDTVEATIDGVKVEGLTCSRKCGRVGVLHYGDEVEVKDLKLRPLNMKPIFNGEDLTGWNIIPDRPSEFSVVDGALNIKSGPGQIETDGMYKDFVLQVAIISHGSEEKPLNSGVFFRGPKGVWWKGYESQVRNEWQDDDRTKPVDFGTGGNYGNQKARRVIPSEGEWFYKTIACHGPHAAVWINGYLVSDYVDMRPVNESSNGKEGYVPGPGTIHLQGHDPGTNLSFKNIVIHEHE